MDYERNIKRRATESFLTLLSGLRKVPANTIEDVAYNSALADAYDYFIEHEPENLYVNTVSQGKWVRD